MSKNQNVVVALFADETTANEAKDAVMQWDKANADIKLGAVGTITKHGDKVKTHVGHKTGKGMWTGAVVGLIAAMFPPVALVGGVLGGAALGGVTGAFFKKPLNLSKEEVQRLAAELDAGKTALVVTCDDDEVEPTRTQLVSLGGTVWSYGIPEETLQAAAAEMPATTEEEATESVPEEVAAAEQPVAIVEEPAESNPEEVAVAELPETTVEEPAAPDVQEATVEAPAESIPEVTVATALPATLEERVGATRTTVMAAVAEPPAAPAAQDAPAENEKSATA